MQREFWEGLWAEGMTPWHRGEPNVALTKHWHEITTRPGVVLVPLCGMTVDMSWLAEQGHKVVGVELSHLAAERFFESVGAPEVDQLGPFQRYRSGDITILVGDFFALTVDHTGPVSAVYDRAAMIALPPEMRSRYTSHLNGLLSVGAEILLVSLEYDQSLVEGPPFAVWPDDVTGDYAQYAVETLSSQHHPVPDLPKMKEAGIVEMGESVFRLVKLRSH